MSLHYVLSALRRHRRLLVVTALIGLLVPLALPVVLPPERSATATLFLVHQSGDDPNLAMTTDVALLQTGAVAGRVIDRLGLHVTTQSLEKQYNGVAVGVSILQITGTGPSPVQAVQRTNAIAAAFLYVRSQLFQSQEQAETEVLSGQVADLQAQVNTLSNDIDALQTTSATLSGVADSAISQRTQDLTQIANIQQTMQSDALDSDSVIDSSKVLVPAVSVPVSRFKGPAKDAGVGLMAGLALGVGVVAAEAILSDRIRRREDFAAALAVSVELSVGPMRTPRWRRMERLRLRLSNPDRNMALMTRQLRSALLTNPRRRLAIVSVDSLAVSALAVASAAGALAREGWRVLVVDLSPGSFLGRMLGINRPGPDPSLVGVAGGTVQVLVPPDEMIFALDTRASELEHPPNPSSALTDRFSDAVVLVLGSLGSELSARCIHAWTGNAVVVVTAGRTSAAKARADADAARAAGLVLRSAILVAADRDDYTPGAVKPDATAGQDLFSVNPFGPPGVLRP